MKFLAVQSGNSEVIEGLLQIYAESNAQVYRKRYAKEYASELAAWNALLQDYVEFICEFVAQDDRYIFALREDDDWVAALRIIRMDGDGWYLEALETAPRHRRKGCARQLLNETIDRLRSLSARSIVSVVDRDNAASRALHETCGFVETSHAPKDVEGNPLEGCIVYQYTFHK